MERERRRSLARARALAPAVALVLPLLAVVGGVVRSELGLHGRSWFFRVDGYDPRDLLRGHYLRFSVQMEDVAGAASCAGSGCCLCLHDRGGRQPPIVESRSCASLPQCDGYLYSGELAGPQRFYIPEQGRRALERRLQAAARERRALVEVVIRDGRAQIKELWLGGEPVAEGAGRSP